MRTSDFSSEANDASALLTPGEGLPAPVADVFEPPVAAPVAAPQRSMRFLIGSLAGGNMLSSFLNLLGGLVMMRLVAPSTLGLFNGIALVQQYVPFLQLGILNGLNRELPFYIGKGEHHRVRELAAAAQAWALLLGGGSAIVLIGISGWQLLQGNFWLAAGWLTNAIMILLLFYKGWYLQLTYRTSNDFARLAMVSVVESVIAMALLVLVAFFSFYGMCLRIVIAGVVGTALLYYWRPLHVGPRWSFHHLKHLLAIGLPIFIVNQILSLWVPINSTLVLRYTGTEGLGLYSVALMAVTALEILPLAVTAVLYPRLAEQYGRTGKVRGLLDAAWKPIVLTFLGMTLVTAAGWVLVGPVVQILAPKYVDAVPVVQWSLLIPLLTSLAPVSLMFNVVRRQDL
ncbi:MAG: oligosaccharide flippase family protein, partial [Planctomycetaceae bacterium]|nr:oligosaccharide flippase family protein [Planctomycetaceae bacterium]